LEHGSDLREGGTRPHHGDEQSFFLEALAEADKEYVDELPIVDGIHEVLELIGDGLEALTVSANWRIALHDVVKFRVERVDAGVNIVLKKLGKGRP
jgi:hypothetical protein